MLIFSTVDLLNATLSGSGPTSYRTKTSIGIHGRKTTSLTLINGTEQRIVGGIDWREKDFVIEGKTWELFELKSRPAGPSNTLRVWHWAGDDYKVNLYGKQWTAISARRLTPLATFNQSVQRIFKASQSAKIEFHTELSETDTVFFLLVMIYSEVRWQDEDVDGHLRGELSD
ncbi:hypothetical protein D9615_009883 [Tricholomella constricta]|uniref:Uncharacterized protein n=1 Tax=Tricholomella constricta TaxID=117010 RepID=A0A8H5GWV1_9AGAR|nr:hypothetical protein D9615_009883 [Tricholomella constricta]